MTKITRKIGRAYITWSIKPNHENRNSNCRNTTGTLANLFIERHYFYTPITLSLSTSPRSIAGETTLPEKCNSMLSTEDTVRHITLVYCDVQQLKKIHQPTDRNVPAYYFMVAEARKYFDFTRIIQALNISEVSKRCELQKANKGNNSVVLLSHL